MNEIENLIERIETTPMPPKVRKTFADIANELRKIQACLDHIAKEGWDLKWPS